MRFPVGDNRTPAAAPVIGSPDARTTSPFAYSGPMPIIMFAQRIAAD
jgi:hypothetical protein